MRAREASQELSPGRKPYLFGLSRPLNLAMADSLTGITRSRIFGMVLRRTIMQKEAVESKEALPGLSRTTPLAVCNEGVWYPNAIRGERSSRIIVGLIRLIRFHRA